MDIPVLKQLGFSDKAAKVYLSLLRLGPSSVRKLADHTNLNRGTSYDALKWLQEQGVVNYYKKDSKQHFVAENPVRLQEILTKRRKEINRVDDALDRVVPELQALFHRGGERPVARYYTRKELPKILKDVLDTCESSEEKMYRIYSAQGVREYIYEDFPNFSDVRVEKGIDVRVIALGKGGELRGRDERKWLGKQSETPTYILIYPGKTAYISLDAKGEPVGVVIENDGVYETQALIFDQLWQTS